MAASSPASNMARHLFDPAEIASMAHTTDIDRRTCQRQVPMQVMSFGVSRTGTVSLRQALIELGFGDCYHYSAAFQENPRDQDMWIEALEGKFEGGRPFSRADWDQLLGHCRALTDTPCTVFWEELLEAYPDAKIILTVRDSADQWVASSNATLMAYAEEFILGVEEPVDDGEAPRDASLRMNKLLFEHYDMFRTLVRDRRAGTQEAKAWYEGHIAAVKERVPAEKLLVLNVKEGWEPLCRFLGVGVPDRPFPRRNDRRTFNKNVGDLRNFMASQG